MANCALYAGWPKTRSTQVPWNCKEYMHVSSDLVNCKQAYYLVIIVGQLFHSLSTKAPVLKCVSDTFPASMLD